MWGTLFNTGQHCAKYNIIKRATFEMCAVNYFIQPVRVELSSLPLSRRITRGLRLRPPTATLRPVNFYPRSSVIHRAFAHCRVEVHRATPFHFRT